MSEETAKVLANRLAQRRFVERLKADPERWESFKQKERRRQRIYYQQSPAYAERKRMRHNTRYARDPDFRKRSATRNATPEAKQRRRALQCLKRGNLKHLPTQVLIVLTRTSRLLKEIAET